MSDACSRWWAECLGYPWSTLLWHSVVVCCHHRLYQYLIFTTSSLLPFLATGQGTFGISSKLNISSIDHNRSLAWWNRWSTIANSLESFFFSNKTDSGTIENSCCRLEARKQQSMHNVHVYFPSKGENEGAILALVNANFKVFIYRTFWLAETACFIKVEMHGVTVSRHRSTWFLQLPNIFQATLSNFFVLFCFLFFTCMSYMTCKTYMKTSVLASINTEQPVGNSLNYYI